MPTDFKTYLDDLNKTASRQYSAKEILSIMPRSEFSNIPDDEEDIQGGQIQGNQDYVTPKASTSQFDNFLSKHSDRDPEILREGFNAIQERVKNRDGIRYGEPITADHLEELGRKRIESQAPSLFKEGMKSLARGVVQLPAMAGKGLQWLDPDGGSNVVENAGQSMEQFSNKYQEKFRDDIAPSKQAEISEWYSPRRMVAYGPENLVASAAPILTGLGVTAMTGNPFSGGAAGLATLGTLFYGGSAEEKYRQAKQSGLDDDAAFTLANWEGGIEAGGEIIADLIPLGLFGKATKAVKNGVIKSIAQGEGLKGVLKTIGTTMAGETTTEIAQAASQTAISNKMGVDVGGVGENVLDVIAPTIFMSLVFGGVSGVARHQNLQQNKKAITETLSNPDATQEDFDKALKMVTVAASDIDKTAAKNFEKYALKQREAGQPIVIQNDFDYLEDKQKLAEWSQTGQRDGQEFTPEHADSFIREKLQAGDFNDQDLQELKSNTPVLADVVNRIDAERVVERANQFEQEENDRFDEDWNARAVNKKQAADFINQVRATKDFNLRDANQQKINQLQGQEKQEEQNSPTPPVQETPKKSKLFTESEDLKKRKDNNYFYQKKRNALIEEHQTEYETRRNELAQQKLDLLQQQMSYGLAFTEEDNKKLETITSPLRTQITRLTSEIDKLDQEYKDAQDIDKADSIELTLHEINKTKERGTKYRRFLQNDLDEILELTGEKYEIEEREGLFYPVKIEETETSAVEETPTVEETPEQKPTVFGGEFTLDDIGGELDFDIEETPETPTVETPKNTDTPEITKLKERETRLIGEIENATDEDVIKKKQARLEKLQGFITKAQTTEDMPTIEGMRQKLVSYREREQAIQTKIDNAKDEATKEHLNKRLENVQGKIGSINPFIRDLIVDNKDVHESYNEQKEALTKTLISINNSALSGDEYSKQHDQTTNTLRKLENDYNKAISDPIYTELSQTTPRQKQAIDKKKLVQAAEGKAHDYLLHRRNTERTQELDGIAAQIQQKIENIKSIAKQRRDNGEDIETINKELLPIFQEGQSHLKWIEQRGHEAVDSSGQAVHINHIGNKQGYQFTAIPEEIQKYLEPQKPTTPDVVDSPPAVSENLTNQAGIVEDSKGDDDPLQFIKNESVGYLKKLKTLGQDKTLQENIDKHNKVFGEALTPEDIESDFDILNDSLSYIDSDYHALPTKDGKKFIRVRDTKNSKGRSKEEWVEIENDYVLGMDNGKYLDLPKLTQEQVREIRKNHPKGSEYFDIVPRKYVESSKDYKAVADNDNVLQHLGNQAPITTGSQVQWTKSDGTVLKGNIESVNDKTKSFKISSNGKIYEIKQSKIQPLAQSQQETPTTDTTFKPLFSDKERNSTVKDSLVTKTKTVKYTNANDPTDTYEFTISKELPAEIDITGHDIETEERKHRKNTKWFDGKVITRDEVDSKETSTPKQKEAWQMTREEFAENHISKLPEKIRGKFNTDSTLKEKSITQYKEKHAKAIYDAASAGIKIPAKVLDSVDAKLRQVVIERFAAQEDGYVSPEEKEANNALEKSKSEMAKDAAENKVKEAELAKGREKDEFFNSSEWRQIEEDIKLIKQNRIAEKNANKPSEAPHLFPTDKEATKRYLANLSESTKAAEERLSRLVSDAIKQGKPIPTDLQEKYGKPAQPEENNLTPIQKAAKAKADLYLDDVEGHPTELSDGRIVSPREWIDIGISSGRFKPEIKEVVDEKKLEEAKSRLRNNNTMSRHGGLSIETIRELEATIKNPPKQQIYVLRYDTGGFKKVKKIVYDYAVEVSNKKDSTTPATPQGTEKVETETTPTTPAVKGKIEDAIFDSDITVEKDGDIKTVSVDLPPKVEKQLTPKEQKQFMLKEIDEAIKQAPETNNLPLLEFYIPRKDDGDALKRYKGVRTIEGGKAIAKRIVKDFVDGIIEEKKANEVLARLTDAINNKLPDISDHVVFNVPNDGEFRILNAKQTLRQFRNKVIQLFPETNPTARREAKGLPSKPTGKRITGENIEYYQDYKPAKQEVFATKENPVYVNGFFKDGAFLIKTEKPDTKLIEAVGEQEEEYKERIKEISTQSQRGNEITVNQMKLVHMSSTIYIAGYTKPLYVHIKDNGKNYFFYAPYIDSMLTKYPDAKIYLSTFKEFPYLRFENQKGEFVGLLERIPDKKSEEIIKSSPYLEEQITGKSEQGKRGADTQRAEAAEKGEVAKPAPDAKFSIAEDIKTKVKDFISKALNKQFLPNLKLGKVNPAHAKKIQSLIGVNVQGYTHELVSRDIKHAMDSHGDTNVELNRKPHPQIAITEEDLNRIPEIIHNPTWIEKGGERADERDSVRFVKRFEDGTIYYVEVVNQSSEGKKGSLQSKTLWKRPSVGVNAVQVAPPDYTSENANSPSGKPSGEVRVPRFDSKITKDSVAVKPSSKISTPASLSELPRRQRKIADNLIKKGTLNPITEAQALNLLQQSGKALYSKRNDLDAIQNKWNNQGFKLFVSEENNEIEIHTIIVPEEKRNSGFGSKIVKEILEYAEKTNQRVLLTPALKDDYHKTTSRSRLIKFYKSLGFVENKGRNKDFRVYATKMYKNPSNVRYSQDGLIQGFVLNGKAYIVPENIESGKMWNVIRHEVGTHIGQLLQNDAEFNKLKDAVKNRKNEKSPDGEAIRKAYSRAEAADTKPEFMEEEVLGYLVEDSPDVSIARKLIALIKKYLAKIGINYDLTQADMVALADIAVRREANRRDKNRQQNPAKFAKSQSTADPIKTDTPAFSAWFKDSKVVDKDGKPLKVYHGTEKAFNIFNKDKTQDSLFWFTVDKEALESGDVGAASVKTIMPVYLSIQKMAGWDEYDSMTIDQIIADGFDGIKLDNDYIVFSPEQIKSATKNKGTFDSNNPDIRFSIAPAAAQATPFSIPDKMNLLDSFQDNYVNQLMSVKKAQDAMGGVSPEADLFTKESLRLSKAADEIKDGIERNVNPQLKLMADSKFAIADVNEYVYSRHAQEANERLKYTTAKEWLLRLDKARGNNEMAEAVKTIDESLLSLNPFAHPKDLYYKVLSSEMAKAQTADEKALKDKWTEFISKPSGITNDEAEKLQDKWKQHPNYKQMKKIAEYFDAMNQEKLLISYKAGRMTEEEYEAIKGTFQYYAPLHREGFEDSFGGGHGKGLTNLGRDTMARGGSTKKAVDMLQHAINDYQTTILKAHKAESTRAFKNFVDSLPEDNGFIEYIKAPTKAEYDKSGNIKHVISHNVQPFEVEFKVDGVIYLARANPKNEYARRIIEQIKENPEKTGFLVKALSKFNRVLAMVNTSLSPEFLFTNFIKDLETASINLQATEISSMTKQVVKDLPTVMKGLHNYMRGNKSHKLTPIIKRYFASGASVGWLDSIGTIEEKTQKLQDELDKLKPLSEVQGNKQKVKIASKKLWDRTGEVLMDYNSVVENALRVSAFKSALDAGVSEEQAAMLAKNLTVNFNAKGLHGQVMNSLYLFSNAGIQGSAKVISVLMKSKKARQIIGASVGLSAGLAIANSMIGGDDDDGVSYYEKIDDFQKQRNIIFMLPNSKGKYVSIPLPWGYNVFWKLGEEVGTAIATWDRYKPLDGVSRMLETTLNAFNPLQSGTLLQTVTPTILDPVASWGENKTWSGSPLMPEQNQFSKYPEPDSQRYFPSARKLSVDIARGLNSLTGGNDAKSGVVDISPETLDLIWDIFTGSAGKFVANTVNVPVKMLAGEELSKKEIPFMRRFVGSKSDYVDDQIFRKNVEHIYQLHAQAEKYPDRIREFKKDKSFYLLNNLQTVEKKIKRLYKRKNALTSKQDIERIQEVIDNTKMKFNTAYNKMVR